MANGLTQAASVLPSPTRRQANRRYQEIKEEGIESPCELGENDLKLQKKKLVTIRRKITLKHESNGTINIPDALLKIGVKK